MRVVRNAFIKQWVEHMMAQSDPKVTREQGNEAWMNSTLRAQILAAREGKQF